MSHDLLTAHCDFMHSLNAAWLELWSEPYIDKDLKPIAAAVSRYAAIVDALATKYREALLRGSGR